MNILFLPQTWTDNMSKTKEPHIADAKESDYTAVTFYPDLTKFNMEKLDDDVVALFTRRAYDIAASSKGVKVFLNGKRLPVRTLILFSGLAVGVALEIFMVKIPD